MTFNERIKVYIIEGRNNFCRFKNSKVNRVERSVLGLFMVPYFHVKSHILVTYLGSILFKKLITHFLWYTLKSLSLFKACLFTT